MLRILLIDDHKLFLEGVKRILESNPLVKEVHAFSEGKKALTFLNSHQVDIMITDLNMPEYDGIELISRVKIDFPKIKICVLTMYYNFNLIAKLRELQIDGYLHKSMGEENFDLAIETINKNQKFFSLESAKVYQAYDLTVNKHTTNTPEIVKDNFIRKYTLSPREFDIFILIINNYSTEQIAKVLFLSKLTISTYRKYIIKKIGCKTVVEFINYAKENGLINYPIEKIIH